jgi:hypothetical protein
MAEVDLHARHLVLLERKAQLVTLLLSDPHAYDLELAAWWLFGQCNAARLRMAGAKGVALGGGSMTERLAVCQRDTTNAVCRVVCQI